MFFSFYRIKGKNTSPLISLWIRLAAMKIGESRRGHFGKYLLTLSKEYGSIKINEKIKDGGYVYA